ncbi:xylosidase [Pedobacter sp. BS3]|uniref:glycoside hydrolase family 71/99-like protein n=1 Tax=Pedobacter sp. BS3 TaxID=2567937 RepID=UPI0011EBAA63|nr:glycoside hydrolase family 71/99-like protein [Pedobacter sp. BS3]TZF85022.1 xylosidase [Pedobacter sp. BS3]
MNLKIKRIAVVAFAGLLIAGLSSCSKKSAKPGGDDNGGTNPSDNNPPKTSQPGDVVGKITVGYQGWFSCDGDNSPMDGRWWHWTQVWEQKPSLTNTGIKSWPDVRDYTHTYATNYPDLNGGGQAKLFSSYDDQTADTQFKWMSDNGIHTAALQRFNPNGIEGPIRDAVTAKVKTYAEKNSVKFYIMYDVTGWTNMQSEIKQDWLNKMKQYTQSSAYATQNGKPVVGIWGFGFSDNNHPWSANVCKEVIDWFKAQGCYVMGGVPTNWRLAPSNNDSRQGYIDVYKSFNMLSPWMIGRIANVNQADQYAATLNKDDLKFCNENGIDYQPCVLPGDLQERQRAHGDFMWRQFYNMVRIGVKSIYVSMFDEYNEGNQIAKTAEVQADVPAGSGIRSLDEDGTACSADYYLRLTGDGSKMLRGEMTLTAKRPTATR